MAMTDEAKARAKEKRAALREIKEKREAVTDSIKLALLNDDDVSLNMLKQQLLDLDAAELALSGNKRGSWEKMPDGRQVREIEIGNYRIKGKIEPDDGSGWVQGAAALTEHSTGNDIVTVAAVAQNVYNLKRRLNAMITGMRHIVRSETASE